MNVPLSVLEPASISAGSTSQQAMRNTVEPAQRAELWNHHRFQPDRTPFVAVATSSPITLMGLHFRIRVGSAAVQARARDLGQTAAV